LINKIFNKVILQTKLHNEELHNVYSSPNIIRMIKSRRLRWAGHVTRMGETRNAYRILWESQKEGDHQEDQDVGGWNILKWILEREDGMIWTGSNWLRIGTSGGLL
jgi:hypothetical protein